MKKILVALAVMAAVAVTSFAAGCGAGRDGAGVAATPGAGGSGDVGAPEGALVVVARNIEFDTDALLAPPGAIMVVLDNRDGGTPHNIHFFSGENARGESVGETPVNNGPVTDTLEMELAAGTYYYQCDIHPNMRGMLEVS